MVDQTLLLLLATLLVYGAMTLMLDHQSWRGITRYRHCCGTWPGDDHWVDCRLGRHLNDVRQRRDSRKRPHDPE